MDEVIGGIIQAAKEFVGVEEGDYIQDGLLYCGKCHTPKQREYAFPWGTMKPYMLCRCGRLEQQKREEEKKALEFIDRVHRLRKDCFPKQEMWRWTFDVDDGASEKASEVGRRYVECFREMKTAGKGLIFFGPTGTGKTFMAACIANALVDKGYPCHMTSMSRILNKVQELREGKQAYIDSLDSYDLLLLDDLGAEGDTEYRSEIVHNVINSRYDSALPLVVTTNLTAQQLKNPADMKFKRIYSRLLEMCIPVEIGGSDRRRQKCRDNFSDYKDMLGL